MCIAGLHNMSRVKNITKTHITYILYINIYIYIYKYIYINIYI